MFQSFFSFFNEIGVNPNWMFMIFGLSLLRCLAPYKLEYKIEENKTDNNKKEYKIYKML